MKYIDFTKEVFFDEAFAIYKELEGMLTFNDLKEMDWLSYEALVCKVQDIQARRKVNG